MADKATRKLYRLKSGSITRYEGEEWEGTRKVVSYEASGQSTGEAGGNLVRLTEKEVQAVGLNRLEEVYGDGGVDNGRIAVVAPATSLTGAPAGVPLTEKEKEDASGSVIDGERGVVTEPATEPVQVEPVHVGEALGSNPTTASPSSGNPAVERVLAKKRAAGSE